MSEAPCEGCAGILDVALDESSGTFPGMLFTLEEEQGSQGFQSLPACDLCPCAPFRLVGEVDVLQFRGVHARTDLLLERRCQLPLLTDGLDDRLFPSAKFLQPFIELADIGYLDLVKIPRPLLTIAGNEGNRTALIE